MFSSLVSHTVAARIAFPRLISKITKAKIQPPTTQSISNSVKETILPSLGVSGAIYSAAIVTALAYPHSEVALIFPPTPPIPIQWGVGALVALDCIGAIRGWRYGRVFSRRFFADTDLRTGCLITMPIWEEPRSEPSTTLTALKFGIFSGPSTRCLTNPPLSQHHNRSPFVEDEVDFPTGPRYRGKRRRRSIQEPAT